MKMINSELKFIKLDNYNKSYSLIFGNRITLFIVLDTKNKNNNFVCIKEFNVAFSFKEQGN